MSAPQYKVEVFIDNCWHHRVWRNNQISAVAICEVESKSRRKSMRVIHQGKIIFKAQPEVSDGKTVRKNNKRNGKI
jgi:hypothetical protein